MASDDDIELVLDVRFEIYSRAKKHWFKNKTYLERSVDALTKLPLFKDLKLAGPDDDVKPFKSIEALKALVAIGRDGVASKARTTMLASCFSQRAMSSASRSSCPVAC